MQEAIAAALGIPLVDEPATALAQVALRAEAPPMAPPPDVEVCPQCGSDNVVVTEGLGLSFPVRFICTCGSCANEWDRVNE